MKSEGPFEVREPNRDVSASPRHHPLKICVVLASLLVIPALILWLSLRLGQARGEYWLAGNSDPAYVYFSAALRLLESGRAVYGDHPGTPVQILAAAVLAVKHFRSGGSNLIEDLAQNPEPYLECVSLVLASVLALATLFAGWRVRRFGIAIAWLVQILPFTLFISVKELGRVSPEPLLLAIVMVLYGVLLDNFCRGRPIPKTASWSLGIIAGTALATKVTSAPILVGLCLLWRDRQNLLRYLKVTLFTAVCWTLPFLWKSIPRLAAWYAKLVTHEGLYGQGEPVIVPRGYLNSLGKTMVEHPHLLTATVLSVGLTLLLKRRSASPGGTRLPLALAAVGILQFLMVARHPYGSRYMLPGTLCLLSLPIFLVWLRRRYPVLVVLSALSLGFWACAETMQILKPLEIHLAERRDHQRLVAREAEALRQTGAIVIPAYRASDPALALYLGGAFNAFPARKTIFDRFPDRVVFHQWGSSFRRLSGYQALFLADFWDGERPLYLQQGRFSTPRLPDGLRIGEVHLGGPPAESLFRIESRSGF